MECTVVAYYEIKISIAENPLSHYALTLKPEQIRFEAVVSAL
jgi:hypothetical protein